MKKFLIGEKVYTFEDVQDMRDGCVFCKCLETGTFAFVDVENGVQFEGERRVIATRFEEKYADNSPYILWGSQLRPRYNWQMPPVRDRC